jgi:hypothetical protein
VGDLPGSLVAARLFATVACLIITAIVIATSLVIFVLPNHHSNNSTPQPLSHAMRAWWTVRGLCCAALFCVLLTFAIFADCGDGDSSTTAGTTTFTTEVSCQPAAGAVLNILNVFLLIALIVMTFGIGVPAKPILTLSLFGGGSTPAVSVATSATAAGPDAKEMTTTKQQTSEIAKNTVMLSETELPKVVVPTTAAKSAAPPPRDQFNDDSLYSC